MNALEQLTKLGVALPDIPTPVGAYVPAVRFGNAVYTSGQIPLVNGSLALTGKVGGDIGVAEAEELAQTCVLNGLAAIHALVGLNGVARVIKLVVYVNSAPGFTAQSIVANAASDLLQKIFGDAGKHARSAVGVAELPLGAPVEVELTAEVAERGEG